MLRLTQSFNVVYGLVFRAEALNPSPEGLQPKL
jgi:hypothetical protein